MFKRMISRVSLVGIAALSVVLVVAVIQAPPRKDSGDSSSSGFSSQGTAAAANRAAGQTRPEELQGVGAEDIQAKIRASDEEWKVIGPKLRRLMVAYAVAEVSFDESTMGDMSGQGIAAPRFEGRGGPGGPGKDSFSNPGDDGPFGRGGPGPGEFGRGGPGRDGFGPGGPGPEGFGLGAPRPDSFGRGRDGFGRGGRGPGGFGRGGPGPGGPPGFGGPGGNAVTRKLAELRTALADPNSTSEQLTEKLDAVRSARAKAKTELAAAHKDLLQLLTADQEAVLVSLNYLD
jgi:outer membrane murein-binding lipoprotein Lpp